MYHEVIGNGVTYNLLFTAPLLYLCAAYKILIYTSAFSLKGHTANESSYS